MSSEERQVRELLVDHGCKLIRKAKHGDIWGIPGGDTFQCYSEADTGNRDWRAWRNQLTQLRRALRSAGLLTEETQEGEVEQPEPAGGGVPDLASMGIHVQATEKVKRVVSKNYEVSLMGESIAKLLGIDLPVGAVVSVRLGDATYTQNSVIELEISTLYEELEDAA